MAIAIFNIVMGLIAIIGGLSGRFVFIGTSSSWVLVLIGLVILGLGVSQLVRRRR